MLMLMFIWFGDVRMGAFTVVYSSGMYSNSEDEPYCLCSIQSDDRDYSYSTCIYCLIQLIELYSCALYLICYSLPLAVPLCSSLIYLFFYLSRTLLLALAWVISLISMDFNNKWLHSAYLIILSNYYPH